jgi:hypothetical protein
MIVHRRSSPRSFCKGLGGGRLENKKDCRNARKETKKLRPASRFHNIKKYIIKEATHAAPQHANAQRRAPRGPQEPPRMSTRALGKMERQARKEKKKRKEEREEEGKKKKKKKQKKKKKKKSAEIFGSGIFGWVWKNPPIRDSFELISTA